MTAPSAPPNEIRVDEIYSDSVHVSWRPPLAVYHNGEIIGYNVTLVTASLTIVNAMFSPDNSTTIPSLYPHTYYGIFVAAITSAGVGPYSTLVTFTTDESGSHVLHSTLSIIQCRHVNLCFLLCL